MQVAPFITPSPLCRTPSTSYASSLKSIPMMARQAPLLCPPVKATLGSYDDLTVDYNNSITSVFPAEACETLGGDACDANIYPEVKLTPEAKSNEQKRTTEESDREYLEYNNPKTVFLEEACDDLGGEFCGVEYLSGAN